MIYQIMKIFESKYITHTPETKCERHMNISSAEFVIVAKSVEHTFR